jgi:cold shock CspA family protein
MLYGNIIRLEPKHGFGFIRDDGGMDWFFLAGDVRDGRFDSIWVDERVGFAAALTDKGPRAADVHHEQLD